MESHNLEEVMISLKIIQRHRNFHKFSQNESEQFIMKLLTS